jgi:hypothetical protein
VRLRVRLAADPWVNYRCVNCGDTGRMDQWACKHCPLRQSLRARARELEARLSRWPCPACYGSGRTGNSRVELRGGWTWSGTTRQCTACGGTGDLLALSAGAFTHYNAAGQYTHNTPVREPLPLTWRAGYVTGVTVPRLAECLEHAPLTALQVGGIYDQHVPTPRLLALCGDTPWGVAIEAVMAGDREPYRDTGHPNGKLNAKECHDWWSLDEDRMNVHNADRSMIPGPVFDTMAGMFPERVVRVSQHERVIESPTADDAHLALGKAIAAFGRGVKPPAPATDLGRRAGSKSA